MKKQGVKFYGKLFWTTFLISAFTFGGGYVIISLMRSRFVDENNWLSEEEMLDITAIAQSAPGIIAVNASILAGYRLAGVLGAVVATFATVLPPLVVISVISFFYEAFRDNVAVAAALEAMQAGVAAVIASATFQMGKAVVKDKGPKPAAIMVICFTAAYFGGVNIIVIIVACIILGIVRTLIETRKAGRQNHDIR